MKKIISILLLAALCLGLLAGCGETAANTGLEAAKKFVHSSYISVSATTAVDYKVMGVTRVDGVEYHIEWSANNDKITFTRGEDKFVTVHVPNDNLDEIKYVLTGTISDAEGKTVTVTFDRVVPARAGVPTEVTTGTYVIVWETTTFSSLTADKNYGYAPFNTVTVSGNTVSNHFKADVLTLTAVEGGFTITDAHGRYVYLKGTYNSFNVSTEAPEDGHVWQLLQGKDGICTIVNKMNGKTLCYDSAYSSWGAYDEVTEARKSELKVIPATAPAVDPEKPSEGGDQPSTPSQPSGEISTPVAGTAYKLGLFQTNKNTMLYFTGEPKANYPWYMLSSSNVADAIDVFVEEVDGGLLLYFMAGETKTYLDMHKDGTHYSLQLTTEPVSVYTWNAELKTFVTTVEDKECVIGTSGTYDTFSCNTMDKIDSTFVAHLYGQGGAETPSEPEQPTTNGVVENVVVGTAYKFGMVQGNLGKTYYLTGAMSSFYMATTEDITAGVDVYLEATEGGYHLYAMVGETKQYINMVVTTGTDGKTHVNGAFEATASTVYTWDAEHKTVVANITVGDKTEPYWHGTRNDKNYNTVGPCAVSYAGFYCQFYGQGGASAPETPVEPETPVVPDAPAVTGTATLATEVAVGDKIVLVNAAGDSAMGAQNEKKRDIVAITVNGNVASLNADVVIITLEKGSQEGTFALKVADGYLAYTNNGNAISTQETVDDAASWTITIVDGVVTIQNVGYSERFLQYNAGSPRFVCYKASSNQQAPVIYKVEE